MSGTKVKKAAKGAVIPASVECRFMQPEVRAARAIERGAGGGLNLVELHSELKSQVVAIQAGDMSNVEAMLYSQAQTLDAMFLELLTRSRMNMGEHLHAADTYMRLALRAQNQCRATLEALAAMKMPAAIYAKQANITSGPQQVNNHPPPAMANEMAGAADFDQTKQSGVAHELC